MSANKHVNNETIDQDKKDDNNKLCRSTDGKIIRKLSSVHAGDLNIDHRLTHEAVLTACRPLPGASVKTILTGETASASEWQSTARAPFVPNYFVDISLYIENKLASLACYKDEMRPSPHPRSLEHIKDLARYRGRSVGVDAAHVVQLLGNSVGHCGTRAESTRISCEVHKRLHHRFNFRNRILIVRD